MKNIIAKTVEIIQLLTDTPEPNQSESKTDSKQSTAIKSGKSKRKGTLMKKSSKTATASKQPTKKIVKKAKNETITSPDNQKVNKPNI